jgi:serine/threonine protein kinase
MADAAGERRVDSGKLNPVLADYIRRRERGEVVDVESLCQAHPDLAAALRSYAAGEGLVEALAGDPEPSLVDSSAARNAETLRPASAQNTDRPTPGKFGKYQILRTLGEGAMGAIYLARDTNLDRDVALKVPKFKGIEGPEFRQRFAREARAAAKLDHPGICRVYDADEVDGTPFICMAYLDGQPLSRSVGTPEFQDQRRVATVIREIASALAHAHEQGVLHRDLKPGNVMLLATGSACVTDFGLARHVNAGEESRITHEGTILGTPAYMSPEQIEGKADKIGPGTDIYALGVILYELLVSRLPFTGSVMAILGKALRDRPTPLVKLRSDVHRELEDLCLQMLEKTPDKRPASMQEVANRLQTWLKHTSPAAQAAEVKAQKNLETLETMKEKILDLVQRGQFAAAVSGLEKMVQIKLPEAKDYVRWARDKMKEVKQAPKQLREGVPALVATAQQCFARHDYAQAAQLLQDIPQDFRTDEARMLLEKSIELQDESDLLLTDLQDCVKRKQFQGIEENLKRFLELKPGNKFAKDLHESLQTYSKIPWKQRKYRFDDRGRLLPRQSALADNWLLWGALCFVLVFGAATWGIMIYLRDDSQTIVVEVDPDWLAEQGGGLSLDVDGESQTLTGPNFEIKLSVKDHSFTVKSGDAIVHNPQTFTIDRAGRQLLRIDRGGIALISMSPNHDEQRQPRQATANEWIDVLGLIDPQRDRQHSGVMWTGDNDWRLEQGQLSYASDGKNGKIRLPVAIDLQSLEYDIEFTWDVLPDSQQYGFTLAFPAQAGPLPLKLETNPATGTGTITLGNQPTSPFRQIPLPDGQRRRLLASLIRQADGSDQMTVQIDGQSLGTWTGDRDSIAYAQFANNREWNARALDVDVFMGTNVTFHAFRMRAFGAASPAEPPVTSPATGSPSVAGQEIDLLAALTPQTMGDAEMRWERKGDRVVCTGTGAAGKSDWKGFRFPTEIGGDYEVELEFQQRAFWPMQIDFPLQDTAVRVSLTGDSSDLMIADDPAQPNAERTWRSSAAKLKTMTPHTLVVRVQQSGTRADIAATLDGVTLGTYSGERRRIVLPDWVKPNLKQITASSLCGNLAEGYIELRRAVYRPLAPTSQPQPAATGAADTSRSSSAVPSGTGNDGWTDLFNGRDLSGWKPAVNTDWRVAGGILTSDAGPRGVLWTDKSYSDFEMDFEFKLSPGANSGVLLRGADNSAGNPRDFEIQLQDDPGVEDNVRKPAQRTGSVYVVSAPRVEAYRTGEWNRMLIRLFGRQLVVTLNGQEVQNLHLDQVQFPADRGDAHRRAAGYIGLQTFGEKIYNGSRDSKLEFRNMRIRRLNLVGEPMADVAPTPTTAPTQPDNNVLVLDDVRIKRLKTVFEDAPLVVQGTNSPFGYVPIVKEVNGLSANAFQVHGTTARRDSAWGFVVMPADRKSDIFVYLRGDGRLSVTENVAATVLAKPVDITLSLDDRDHELAVVIEPRQFRVFVDGKSVAPPIPFQRDLKTDQVALLKVGAGDAEFRNLVIGQRLP